MSLLSKLEEAIVTKLEKAVSRRWCPVCGRGRPLMPGAVQIECWNCGVWIHCDNWYTAPQEKIAKEYEARTKNRN